MTRRLAAVAAFLAACSPTPPPVAHVSPPPAPPDAGPIEDDEACAKADALIEEAGRRLDPHPPQPVARTKIVCARALLERASHDCPRSAADVSALLQVVDERARLANDAAFSLSDDERWLLQQQWAGDARIWELTAAGPSLSLRLSVTGDWMLGKDGRALALEKKEGTDAQSLAIVDLAAHHVDRVSDVEAYAVIEHDLFVASKTALRRFAWPSLDLQETVAVTIPDVALVGFRALAAGRRVIVGDTLVSLDDQRAIAHGYRFLDTSKDGARIVACTDAKDPHLAILSTKEGDVLADFDLQQTPQLCTYSLPTLSPDGRFAIAVDIATADNGASTMVVVVFDVATRKVARFPDKSMSPSTALGIAVDVEDEKPPRVCVHYGNYHWQRDECPWTLDEKGRIAKAKSGAVKKTVGPKLPDVQLAATTSADAKTRVVATAKASKDSYTFEHLRLHVVDEGKQKVARVVEVAAAPFVVESTPGSAPSLRFLDATHVLYDPGRTATPMGVLDVETGTLRAIDDANLQLLGTRFGIANGTFVDLLTQATTPLVPTEDAWKNAPEIRADCP